MAEDGLLELAEAAGLLGVHQSTLRRWADNGKVPHVRTLSGRRRFTRQSILNAREVMDRNTPNVESEELELKTLSLARQHASHPPDGKVDWIASLNEDQRLLLRYSGQRLLGLMLQYIRSKDSGDAYLIEGRRMADDYGRVCYKAGLSISETAEAFLYFRRSILESVQSNAGLSDLKTQEADRIFLRAVDFFDALLVATIDSYNHLKPTE